MSRTDLGNAVVTLQNHVKAQIVALGINRFDAEYVLLHRVEIQQIFAAYETQVRNTWAAFRSEEERP